jgi:tRNA-splicing ligase RtcB
MTKVSDVEYRIEPSAKSGMRVPVTIYANEKLIEKMQTDRTIDQAVNVTFLPGVRKHMIVLPDGHEGYGFPIGGVAATDFESGVISPGGVGYDINCLPPETQVLTPLGFRTAIESLQPGNKVTCFSRREARNTSVVLSLSRIEHALTRIRTKSGLEIRATGDHPILTRTGMKMAGEVSKGSLVATHPFIGVEFEQPKKIKILDSEVFPVFIAEELRARNLLPLDLCDEKLPYLVKLLAYFMGDGSLEGKKTWFYGTYEGMEEIRRDIEFLGYTSSKIISRNKLEKINGEICDSTEYSLYVSAWSFRRLIEALGAPRGGKTALKRQVPTWLFETPLWIKRLFVAAYCGAEMIKPQTINGYNFEPPVISIDESLEAKEGGKEFLKQLSELFEELGVEVCGIHEEKIKESHEKIRLKIQLSTNALNLKMLWSTIGYIYTPHKQRLAIAASSWIGWKSNIIGKRERDAMQVAQLLSNGQSISSIEENLSSPNHSQSFIEKRIDASCISPVGVPFSAFPKFEDWAKSSLDGDIVWDEISETKTEEYTGPVYDITVADDSHNFAADGFVVSNCGVRLIRTSLTEKQVRPKLRDLVREIFRSVPSGLGNVGALNLSNQQLDDVLSDGVKWAISNGYGNRSDLEHCEENGTMKHSDSSKVSGEAKKRGAKSLGTLGSGNHFLEIETVNKVHDGEAAKAFGIDIEGQVCVLMHTGSRGLGHQVCSDYLKIIDVASPNFKIDLPDRELACAPSGSREAENYRFAMGSALNYAWTNRQVITHRVRKAFERVMNMSESDLDMKLVYDVAHNICKVEEHNVDPSNPKKKEKVFVHRKGATRAFPKGSEAIPQAYRSIGQPVLIPGSMGTASWVLLGRDKSMEASFGSTAHGAGRMMSRGAAIRSYPYDKVKQDLESRGILLEAASKKGVVEEAPGAYKDVDSVVEVSDRVGIGTKVVRLTPMGVVKG